jgi:chitinase
MNFSVVQNSLNFINVLNYDFDGPWNTATNFVAPLYQSASVSSSTNNVNYVVQSYIGIGVPKSKFIFDMPFYAYEWGNVTKQNNGLFEACTVVPGRNPPACPNQTYDYNAIGALTCYTMYRDSLTQEPWPWDGNKSFVTYDDSTSLGLKANYVVNQCLDGTMIWELSGDTNTGKLIQTLTGAL